MSTLTVFGDTADGYVQSFGAVYSTVRSGDSLLLDPGGADQMAFGQRIDGGTYAVEEGFIAFDTSSLGASAIISAVALSLYGVSDQSTTNFTAEARVDDWGATCTTGDFVAGGSLSTLTRVATFASAGFAVGAYNAFSEDGTNFQSNVNKTGTTRLVLCSANTVANITPTTREYLQCNSANAAGTTNDPKLVITYTVSSPANLVLGAAAGVAIASATLSTKGLLVPASAGGVATAAVVVQTPVLIALDAVDGIAVATLDIYTPNPYVLPGVSAGLSSAALAVYTVSLLVGMNAAGVATATLVVTRPIRNSYIIHGGVRVVHTRMDGAGRMNVRRIDGGVPS